MSGLVLRVEIHTPGTFLNVRTFLLLLALLTSGVVRAQSGNTVRGRVVDGKTGEPLPYATLYAPAQKTGTLANETGRFSLRLGSFGSGDVMTVSLVGYQTLRLPLQKILSESGEQTLRLQPAANTLNEVVVRPVDPSQLIRDAIRRVTKNYPRQPALLQGFYREWVRATDFLVLSEGQLELYKASYNSPVGNDQVRMLKGRRKPLPNYFVFGADTCRLPSITNGPNLGLLLDVVRFTREINFLDYSGYQNYAWELAGQTTVDDRETYILSFQGHPDYYNSVFFAGKVYLDRESLAVVRAEFHVSPPGLATFNRSMTINRLPLRLQKRDYVVSYQRQDDGRYVLNHAQSASQYYYVPHPTVLIRNHMDFVVTKVTFGPTVRHFPNREIIGLDQSFVEQTIPFDSSFWDDDNVILED